jgi:hypothetical protein
MKRSVSVALLQAQRWVACVLFQVSCASEVPRVASVRQTDDMAPSTGSTAVPGSAHGQASSVGGELRGPPPCLPDGTHPRSEYGDWICCGVETEIPGVSCVQPWLDGGIYGDYGACLPEGSSFERKFAGSVCCNGGTEVHALRPALPGEGETTPGCTFAGVPSTGICVFCGDGACGDYENSCNCPADCPK